MSLIQIQTVVENFINNDRSGLLVLKGAWGVGKTFFWKSVITRMMSEGAVGCKHYSYVSLFGVNDLNELRSEIAISRVSKDSTPSEKTVNKNLRSIVTQVEKIPALDKYIGGTISAILRSQIVDTIICFDDFERKSERLEIKEILGLAAVLKEQRKCKVVLIVNDDALDEAAKQQFKIHGEKLVDREVLFELTPEESFNCVFSAGRPHYDLIKQSILTLGIPNIRILQRIHQYLDDMLPLIRDSEQQTIQEAIRSLILYVWSYYGQGNGAPPLSFILNFSTLNSWLKREKGIEETTDEKNWSIALNSYNYSRTDDVDRSLAAFVQTGYVNSSELTQHLRKKNEHYRAQTRDLSYREAWSPFNNSFENNEDEIVNELLTAFRIHAEVLSPRDLQEVVGLMRQLNRNTEANALIDDYFSQRSSAADVEGFKGFKRSSFSDEVNDEYLLHTFEELLTTSRKDTRTLAEVVEPMAFTNGWELDDVRYMNSFSADDYYHFFKSYKGDKLYWCVKKCLDFDQLPGDNGTYQSVGRKAREALIRIAGESKLNRIRVSTRHKIDIPEPDAEV